MGSFRIARPLNAFNNLADLLTRNTVATVIEEARASHLLHHQNATALRYQFQIPRETAREIVCSCLHCSTLGATCRDPAPADPGSLKRGRCRRASGYNSFN